MSNKEINKNSEQNSADKRKRSEKSSCSDFDTSLDQTERTDNKNKQSKKKSKIVTSLEPQTSASMSDLDLKKQLNEINKKLSNVITKDDDSIKNMIRETFLLMKTELLESVSHRIDILEGKLFDKEEENSKLKEKLELLENENEIIKTAQNQAKLDDKTDQEKIKEQINNLEQYGRRNNLRIDGIAEDYPETAEQTGRKLAECLNATIQDLNIRRCDIDIAHRIGKRNNNNQRPRQIIVKFVSRMTRDAVWQGKKLLTRLRVFVNEDLTQLNAHVMTCIRKKLPDEVETSWSNNGRLYFKNKSGSDHEVKYKDYKDWLKMNWPEKLSDETDMMA